PGVQACWMQNGPLVPDWGTLLVPAGPVAVTPWDDAADRASETAKLVSWRQLTASRATFSHAEPLPCRFAAVSFRIATHDGFVLRTMLVRLLWCRFTGRGDYVSGGRVERMLGEEFDAGRVVALLGE